MLRSFRDITDDFLTKLARLLVTSTLAKLMALCGQNPVADDKRRPTQNKSRAACDAPNNEEGLYMRVVVDMGERWRLQGSTALRLLNSLADVV